MAINHWRSIKGNIANIGKHGANFFSSLPVLWQDLKFMSKRFMGNSLFSSKGGVKEISSNGVPKYSDPLLNKTRIDRVFNTSNSDDIAKLNKDKIQALNNRTNNPETKILLESDQNIIDTIQGLSGDFSEKLDIINRKLDAVIIDSQDNAKTLLSHQSTLGNEVDEESESKSGLLSGLGLLGDMGSTTMDLLKGLLGSGIDAASLGWNTGSALFKLLKWPLSKLGIFWPLVGVAAFTAASYYGLKAFNKWSTKQDDSNVSKISTDKQKEFSNKIEDIQRGYDEFSKNNSYDKLTDDESIRYYNEYREWLRKSSIQKLDDNYKFNLYEDPLLKKRYELKEILDSHEEYYITSLVVNRDSYYGKDFSTELIDIKFSDWTSKVLKYIFSPTRNLYENARGSTNFGRLTIEHLRQLVVDELYSGKAPGDLALKENRDFTSEDKYNYYKPIEEEYSKIYNTSGEIVSSTTEFSNYIETGKNTYNNSENEKDKELSEVFSLVSEMMSVCKNIWKIVDNDDRENAYEYYSQKSDYLLTNSTYLINDIKNTYIDSENKLVNTKDVVNNILYTIIQTQLLLIGEKNSILLIELFKESDRAYDTKVRFWEIYKNDNSYAYNLVNASVFTEYFKILDNILKLIYRDGVTVTPENIDKVISGDIFEEHTKGVGSQWLDSAWSSTSNFYINFAKNYTMPGLLWKGAVSSVNGISSYISSKRGTDYLKEAENNNIQWMKESILPKINRALREGRSEDFYLNSAEKYWLNDVKKSANFEDDLAKEQESWQQKEWGKEKTRYDERMNELLNDLTLLNISQTDILAENFLEILTKLNNLSDGKNYSQTELADVANYNVEGE